MSDDHGDEERVELLRTHEPLRAEMIRELLESEGIPVSTPGLEHRAMVGVMGSYVEIVVQVPRRDRERAQALLDALEAAPIDGPDLRDEDEPREERAVVSYRDAARAPSTVAGKRRRVAAFASMVIPGGGHLYVAQWRSAGIVALVEVLALVLAGAGMPFAIFLLPLAVLGDVLGAIWHCERLAGRDVVRSKRRFAPEIVAAFTAIWVALMMGPGAAWVAGPRTTSVCEAMAECGDVELRECLWASASSFSELYLPPSCESCIDEATCDDLYQCRTCFE
ncbi:DUF2007 domain-containing protein [Sandaracinus amylolyticus]|uniref:putative signal transducing protein n=1 Tax=Sandaracinus amylolyticus TaxID=927083 RepID=UPI001F22AB33|nr:DUF2007 domain-containing protein [Sandaracinus amylolyticus]UJR83260.1 Hypothetical protein I5071_53270 [Sandaracinus amylolyticus]